MANKSLGTTVYQEVKLCLPQGCQSIKMKELPQICFFNPNLRSHQVQLSYPTRRGQIVARAGRAVLTSWCWSSLPWTGFSQKEQPLACTGTSQSDPAAISYLPQDCCSLAVTQNKVTGALTGKSHFHSHSPPLVEEQKASEIRWHFLQHLPLFWCFLLHIYSKSLSFPKVRKWSNSVSLGWIVTQWQKRREQQKLQFQSINALNHTATEATPLALQDAKPLI